MLSRIYIYACATQKVSLTSYSLHGNSCWVFLIVRELKTLVDCHCWYTRLINSAWTFREWSHVSLNWIWWIAFHFHAMPIVNCRSLQSRWLNINLRLWLETFKRPLDNAQLFKIFAISLNSKMWSSRGFMKMCITCTFEFISTKSTSLIFCCCKNTHLNLSSELAFFFFIYLSHSLSTRLNNTTSSRSTSMLASFHFILSHSSCFRFLVLVFFSFSLCWRKQLRFLAQLCCC